MTATTSLAGSPVIVIRLAMSVPTENTEAILTPLKIVNAIVIEIPATTTTVIPNGPVFFMT
jgi:hypothetical protein